MKKLIILIIALLIAVGCESTIDGSGDSNGQTVINTVSIGLTGRNYEYAEVYDSDGSFHKLYYTATNSLADTMYVDVPYVDTVTMITYNVSESDDDICNVVRFAPVADSVFKFRF